MERMIYAFILIMVIISFISADSIPIIKTSQNTCINLQQTISNASYCTITVQYPITNIWIIRNETMSRFGDIYNYTFCNTTKLEDYVVLTQCNPNGVLDDPISYTLRVTPTGKEFDLTDIFVYLFFLLICLIITFFSFKLTNSSEKDEITSSQLYEMKKRHELKFYANILKRKLWIVGLFGIYLSILLFLSLLDQLIFSLGLSDLVSILSLTLEVLLWGLIPFILFWLGYIILYVYKSTEEILRYQLGGIK